MPLRTAPGLLMLLALLAGASRAGQPPAPPPKAAPKPKAKAAPDEPVHVWADKVRYVRAQRLVRVLGNATIIKKDLRIDADQVLAHLDENNQFTRILATGHVRIHSVPPLPERTVERPPLAPTPEPNFRKALCHHADYDMKTNVVVLTAHPDKPDAQPVVWINKDEVHADKITFDQNRNLTTFEGRVKLHALTPKGEERGPGLPMPGPR